jgi:hypothetical protein
MEGQYDMLYGDILQNDGRTSHSLFPLFKTHEKRSILSFIVLLALQVALQHGHS